MTANGVKYHQSANKQVCVLVVTRCKLTEGTDTVRNKFYPIKVTILLTWTSESFKNGKPLSYSAHCPCVCLKSVRLLSFTIIIWRVCPFWVCISCISCVTFLCYDDVCLFCFFFISLGIFDLHCYQTEKACVNPLHFYVIFMTVKSMIDTY